MSGPVPAGRAAASDPGTPVAPGARRPARPQAVRRGRHVPVGVFAVLVVGMFAGVIGIAMATGAWQTTGRTTAGGQRVELATGAPVTEVKGWMAVGDVAQAFGVPLPELLAAFELPADTPPETALKDLESDLFEVSALRDWLAARGGADQ